MARILAVAPHAAPQKYRFLGEVVLGLAADGHAEECVEDGVGRVVRTAAAINGLVVVVTDAPRLGAIRVEQFDCHLTALTELKGK